MLYEFDVHPRQSGKTKLLIKNAIHRVEQGYIPIIIVNNLDMKNRVQQELEDELLLQRKYTNEIIDDKIEIWTAKRYLSNISNGINKFDAVLIDEYMYMPLSVQKNLYIKIKKNKNITWVIIKTSPSKQFDRNLVNTIKYLKSKNIKIESSSFGEDSDDVDYLYYNFLTDENTHICCFYDIYKSGLSPIKFELEHLGKLFK